jgi:hypothetical protein
LCGERDPLCHSTTAGKYTDLTIQCPMTFKRMTMRTAANHEK